MWRNWGKYIIRVFVILVIVLFAIVAVAELLIGSGVRAYSQTAQAHFPAKRVQALIAMVGCESCNMQDRNHAVWTLGQLDDPRALPVLEKYYTGAKCDHPKNLCQDTLQIALRHLRHEDNNRFESVLWRWMLPAEN
jgi:HEAT repeat protein